MVNIGQNNLIALSGGIDSTVLLHKMVALREQNKNIQLRAVHINHQLSPNATHWEKHCSQICEELNVQFISKRVNAKPQVGESPEDAARKVRYAVFEDILFDGEYLLTAHNADDQAETLLLQLLRGAGPKGLASMPQLKAFSKGYHARPLLNLTRDEIVLYAEKNNLKWVEDESNQYNKFDRNFLRNTIMPLLKERWPQLAKTFSRSASHCAEAATLLADVAKEDFNQSKDENDLIIITELKKLSHLRQKNLLRYYLNEEYRERISVKKLEELMGSFLLSDEDKNPVIELENNVIQRYKDRLWVIKKMPTVDLSIMIPWDLKSTLNLPCELGELNPADFNFEHTESVTVRFRQGGEKCKPVGREGTHSLKKLFQEWNVPPWERDRVPLIYVGEEIAHVVGFCACDY